MRTSNNEIFSGNLIGDEGALKIAEALRFNTSLSNLNLSCSRIRGEVIELIQVFRNS